MTPIRIATPTNNSTRTWIAAVALLLTAAAFVYLGGIPGAVSAGMLALCWLLLSPVYVVAVGHILLVALTLDGLAITDALLAELGLLAVLLIPVQGLYRRGTLLVGTAIAITVLLVLTDLTLLFTESLRIAAIVLVGTGSLAAYVLHRYELVVVGLVERSSS